MALFAIGSRQLLGVVLLFSMILSLASGESDPFDDRVDVAANDELSMSPATMKLWTLVGALAVAWAIKSAFSNNNNGEREKLRKRGAGNDNIVPVVKYSAKEWSGVCTEKKSRKISLKEAAAPVDEVVVDAEPMSANFSFEAVILSTLKNAVVWAPPTRAPKRKNRAVRDNEVRVQKAVKANGPGDDGSITPLNSVQELSSLLEAMPKDRPIILQFSAPWCGPCRRITPAVTELAMQLRGSACFCKINIDNSRDLASAFRVTSIPVFAILRDGSERERVQGANAEALRSAVMQAVFQQPVNFRSAIQPEGEDDDTEYACCASAHIAFDETSGLSKVISDIRMHNDTFKKRSSLVARSLVLSDEEMRCLEQCCKTLRQSNRWHSLDSALDIYHLKALRRLLVWPHGPVQCGLLVLRCFSAHPMGGSLLLKDRHCLTLAISHIMCSQIDSDECSTLAYQTLCNILAFAGKSDDEKWSVSVSKNCEQLINMCAKRLGESSNASVAAASLLHNIALFLCSPRCESVAALRRQMANMPEVIAKCNFVAAASLACRKALNDGTMREERTLAQTALALGSCTRKLFSLRKSLNETSATNWAFDPVLIARAALRCINWLAKRRRSRRIRAISDDLGKLIASMKAELDSNPRVERRQIPNPWR